MFSLSSHISQYPGVHSEVWVSGSVYFHTGKKNSSAVCVWVEWWKKSSWFSSWWLILLQKAQVGDGLNLKCDEESSLTDEETLSLLWDCNRKGGGRYSFRGGSGKQSWLQASIQVQCYRVGAKTIICLNTDDSGQYSVHNPETQPGCLKSVQHLQT